MSQGPQPNPVALVSPLPHLLHPSVHLSVRLSVHLSIHPSLTGTAGCGGRTQHGKAWHPVPVVRRPLAWPGLAHRGHLDDVWDVEIGLHRGEAAADEVGFVCFLPVHLARVLLRVDGHRADAQLRAGSEHADGDLAWGWGSVE